MTPWDLPHGQWSKLKFSDQFFRFTILTREQEERKRGGEEERRRGGEEERRRRGEEERRRGGERRNDAIICQHHITAYRDWQSLIRHGG